MTDEFSLYQDDGRADEASSGESAGRELVPAGGDFELAIRQAPGAPTDADGDGVPDGLAFDLDHDGLAHAVELDTSGDGMADTGLFDLNQDGAAEAVTMDTDGDGTADVSFALEQAPEPFVGVPCGDDPHSLSDAPDEITQSDVEDAAQDLSAQSHIQSGMNDMYGAIYHESVDPF